MTIITVTGEIPSDQTGMMLTHEHILSDLTCYMDPDGFSDEETKIDLSNLWDLKYGGVGNKDTLVLQDVDDAIYEVNLYKKAGGDIFVDLTPDGIGRNPKGLETISKRTGVKIIAGSGYYVGLSHPAYIKKWSVERVKEEIVKDLTVGIGDTGIRAGIIGEIGAADSKPTAEEAKTIEAAGLAQAETGAGIIVHCRGLGRFNSPDEPMKILEKSGADLSKVGIAHRESQLSKFKREDYLRHYGKIIDKGAYVCFDCFGHTGYSWTPDWKINKVNMPEKNSSTPVIGTEEYFNNKDWETVQYKHTDRRRYDWVPFYVIESDMERVEGIMDMIEVGYIKNLLLSHDVCSKLHYRKYGGQGLGHIYETIIPMLREAGITQRQIDIILKENPRRLVSIK